MPSTDKGMRHPQLGFQILPFHPGQAEPPEILARQQQEASRGNRLCGDLAAGIPGQLGSTNELLQLEGNLSRLVQP